MPDVPPGALVAFGFDDRVLAQLNALGDARLRPARVVRAERTTVHVVDVAGADAVLAAPPDGAVGDWLAVAEGVATVLERRSAIRRLGPDGAEQVLAANVDVVIVAAPADRLAVARVERELAIAFDSGATPLVALTKADLAAAGDLDELAARLSGVEVLAVSAKSGLGIEALAERLRPARTAVVIGPSGAGKSTITNALAGAELLATGAVRAADGRGRHTTTARQLVRLPAGGLVIDTPGLRSLGLAGDVDVDQAFPDIESLAAGCRFDDCRHDAEPGCAVVEAVTSGALERARLANYAKLQGEVAAERRRADPVARRAQRRRFPAVPRLGRDNGKRPR